MSSKNFHHPELFVGDGQYAHMPLWWQDGLDPFNMHLGIFFATAMPYVHAELEHTESVRHYSFPELRVVLPVFFGFSWQIKMY